MDDLEYVIQLRHHHGNVKWLMGVDDIMKKLSLILG